MLGATALYLAVKSRWETGKGQTLKGFDLAQRSSCSSEVLPIGPGPAYYLPNCQEEVFLKTRIQEPA